MRVLQHSAVQQRGTGTECLDKQATRTPVRGRTCMQAGACVYFAKDGPNRRQTNRQTANKQGRPYNHREEERRRKQSKAMAQI
jgi:hypothetical protein